MNASAVVSRCRLMGAAVIALILPLSGVAQDSVPQETLSVKVFPDRYVAAGKQFHDLAALEAWAKPTRIRTLWLDSCGSESTGHLLAAVERFHKVYAQGVQIRTFAAADSECLGAVKQASSGPGGVSDGLSGLPYYASDLSGRSAVP